MGAEKEKARKIANTQGMTTKIEYVHPNSLIRFGADKVSRVSFIDK